jgi:hypothetical protein
VLAELIVVAAVTATLVASCSILLAPVWSEWRAGRSHAQLVRVPQADVVAKRDLETVY